MERYKIRDQFALWRNAPGDSKLELSEGTTDVILMSLIPMGYRSSRDVAAPRSYDVVTSNCEHSANEVVRGRAFSRQLQAVAVVGFGVGIIYLICRNP